MSCMVFGRSISMSDACKRHRRRVCSMLLVGLSFPLRAGEMQREGLQPDLVASTSAWARGCKPTRDAAANCQYLASTEALDALSGTMQWQRALCILRQIRLGRRGYSLARGNKGFIILAHRFLQAWYSNLHLFAVHQMNG